MKTVTIIVNDEFGNGTQDPQKNTYPLDLETEGFEVIKEEAGQAKPSTY